MVLALEKPVGQLVDSTELDGVKLNSQQSQFCEEFLEWLDVDNHETPQPRMKGLRGRAGSGKSFTIKYALIKAWKQGLLNGRVVACAPTHQAKSILAKALQGAPVSEISTSHSLLQLRPRIVEFKPHDESRLDTLLGIHKNDRTSDEERIIDWLQIKQAKAAEQVQEFVSHGSLSDLEDVRLIIVDEGWMLNSYMFGLFADLIYNPDPLVEFHPDLQILFMGDNAQLPPIDEVIGKADSLPFFTQLTKIERYSGAILDYCTGMYDYAIGKKSDESYKSLHHHIKPQGDDDSLLCMPSYEILNADVLKEVYESDSVRFVASTNKRVAELNYMIRALLKNDAGQNALFYEPGDIILTMSGVQHGVNGLYDIACSARKEKLEIGTSTLVELGDPVLPGETVSFGSGYSTMVTNRSLEFKSVLGTTFQRLIYRYRVYASGDEFGLTKAICLIDPEQFSLWKMQCDQLLKRAKTTQSRGKSASTARGQEGDAAKEVWAAYGMKNWNKWLDGRAVEKPEYDRIKKQLWLDYYNLLQFADNANFSYASSVHRLQGATVDVVVFDTADIFGRTRNWTPQKEDTWDEKKLAYTAASRASKQLVFMT